MASNGSRRPSSHDVHSSWQSSTFDRDVEIRVHETVGSASVSPSGRDVVLASVAGLHIVDLDSPYTAPRFLSHQQQWPPADVQWSPFAARDYWIVSTSNQKALVWNLDLHGTNSPIQHTLHGHHRTITDINFSAHYPDLLATCAVDSFVHTWDLRAPEKPVITFADWNAGATQVKYNRQDEHILASSHDKFLHIWDNRKGAYPLKTIEAHTTKIYGIDWNRIRESGILTCSLDQSIKFWDYKSGNDKPERVIRTQFPVWRARHTPFGWGVLALPQRGDNDLHLYDRRLSETTPRIGFVDAAHTFSGHQSNVKEFLWRSRGSIEDGFDQRDFQLISWGNDRVLHLHRVDEKVLRSVGYEKGKEVRKSMPMTRQGAEYKTFNVPKPKRAVLEQNNEAVEATPSLLGKMVAQSGMSKMPLPVVPVGREQSSMTYSGKLRKRTADPIKWMQGVTMRSRSETMSKGTFGLDNPESLKDEMTTVSQKYTKVNFEIADVHGRTARVNLNGPWGPNDNPAFLRINFEFPGDYPSVSPAICSLEKTAAGISDETIQRLSEEMQSIVDHYQARKLGCLEAVITYLLGERGLEESITLPDLQGPYDLLSPASESSSDDDDDAADGAGHDMETSADGVIGSAQANAPLPKACGAYWSNDGRLVCFFPPKPEPKPLFSLDTLRVGGGDKSSRGHRHYEGFGRLQEESPGTKRRAGSVDDEDPEDSAESWTSSSSSSSDDSLDDMSRLPSRFHPPAAWRAATLKMPKSSSHSGSGGGTNSKRSATNAKPKSVVTIHKLEELLPAQQDLAADYMIFGPGPRVCEHNADVCRVHGFDDHATTWEVCRHLLFNEVPLEILEQSERKEPILIEAKRQMVRVRRKDSGLDLAFDEPANVVKPLLTGRVKWGAHPHGSAWLVPELFDYYERLGDIQMLAMLSCIFCEPAAREGISNIMAGIKHADLPIPMQAPAFSLDYFTSSDVAWSFFRESEKIKVQSATPKEPRSAGPSDYFDSRVATFGSANSSNGPWERDMMPSGPQTPYSTGDTPPAVTPQSVRSHRNSMVNSLSTSPEQTTNKPSRRTNSNLSAAFSLSKAFTSLSTSPSTQDRFKAAEADLSTSAPTAPTSGITWGSNTIISSQSSKSPEKARRSSSRRSSFKAVKLLDTSYSTESDIDGHETDDSYYDAGKVYTPINRAPAERKIKVSLSNQHLFDTEGHASVPLLPPEDAHKYNAYRQAYADQLGAWGLHIQQAEILKFSGLLIYWQKDTAVYPLNEQLAKTPAFNKRNAQAAIATRRPGLEDDIVTKTANTRTKTVDFDLIGRTHRSAPQLTLPDPSVWKTDTDAPLTPLESSVGVTDPMVPTKRSVPDDWLPLRNCKICWERIQGLYVDCPRADHRAHVRCYTSYISDMTDEEIAVKGVGCGCLPFDIDDVKSEGNADWSAVYGGSSIGRGKPFGAL